MQLKQHEEKRFLLPEKSQYIFQDLSSLYSLLCDTRYQPTFIRFYAVLIKDILILNGRSDICLSINSDQELVDWFENEQILTKGIRSAAN